MNANIALTIIATIISIGIFFIAIISFYRKGINDTSCKIKKVYSHQAEVRRDLELKIEKQDEESKEQYVNKDVCKVIHDNNKENFQRLERQVREGFAGVNKSFADMNKTVMQLLRKNGIS